MRPLLIIIILILGNQLSSAQQDKDWTDYLELYNQKEINTEYSEFSPTYWNDQIVFVKSRPRQKLLDRKTNEPYFDLYLASKNKVGSLFKPEALSKSINTEFHEGPASFLEMSEEVFFTRVDYEQGKFNLSNNKEVALKIFNSTRVNNEWTKPTKITLNEDNVAMAHPTLKHDKDFMIFASDRPGGYGKMDLYVSHWNGTEWLKPINLGKNINSSGNDWFPYINKRGYLFYASDGKSDAQGLDIYIAENINSTWERALRLPAPINTAHDDFGLIIDANGTNGFMTSNRPGGAGKDDIYAFNSLVSLFTYYDSDYNTVYLDITDSETKQVLDQALIKYKSLDQKSFETFDKEIFIMDDGPRIKSLYSDKDGRAKFNIEEGYTLLEVTYPKKEKWTLVLSNHGSSKNIDVILKDLPEPEKVEPQIVYIEKEVPAPTTIKNVAVDVGAVIVFDNIYYDYNSFILTLGAKKELDVLADLMKSNGKLKIQLSAHTDSRGEADYNLSLSQKRADSARDYLVSRGIPQYNIVSVGHGESQLRNHCKDGTYCSEAEHIYNRRTEVKILQK